MPGHLRQQGFGLTLGDVNSPGHPSEDNKNTAFGLRQVWAGIRLFHFLRDTKLQL